MSRLVTALALLALLPACPNFDPVVSADAGGSGPADASQPADAGGTPAYRAALVVQGGGTVDVVTFTAAGSPTVTRSLSKAADTDSPWPDFSADGTQLAYPSGSSAAGAVYLFDVQTSDEPYQWFAGRQPGFSAKDLTLVARAQDDAVVYDPAAKKRTEQKLSGVQVRWPRFDPADPNRFAFLDETSGTVQLSSAGSADAAAVTESAVKVQAFAWLPDGKKMAVLEQDASGGTCTARLGTLDAGKLGAYVTLATKVDCTARLLAAPVGEHLALVAGKAIHVLNATAAIDASTTTPTVTLDQPARDADWTSDAAYLAVLKPAEAGGPGRLFLVSPTDQKVTAITTTGDYERIRASPAMH